MGEMEFDKFVRPLENSLASELTFDLVKDKLQQYAFSLEEGTAG